MVGSPSLGSIKIANDRNIDALRKKIRASRMVDLSISKPYPAWLVTDAAPLPPSLTIQSVLEGELETCNDGRPILYLEVPLKQIWKERAPARLMSIKGPCVDVEFEITYKDKSFTAKAVLDSGSTASLILPARKILQLGLPLSNCGKPKVISATNYCDTITPCGGVVRIAAAFDREGDVEIHETAVIPYVSESEYASALAEEEEGEEARVEEEKQEQRWKRIKRQDSSITLSPVEHRTSQAGAEDRVIVGAWLMQLMGIKIDLGRGCAEVEERRPVIYMN